MLRPFVIATFTVLSSAASAAQPGGGFWQNAQHSAYLFAHQKDRGFIFHYINAGEHRCDVPGLALPSDKPEVFIFKNQSEHWLGDGKYEGYGTELNADCAISFTFASNNVVIAHEGNCQSFCGVRGDLDATLTYSQPRECFDVGDNGLVYQCIEQVHSQSQAELQETLTRLQSRVKRDAKLLADAQSTWLAFKNSECEVRSVSAQAFRDPERQKDLFSKLCAVELNTARILQLKDIPLGCDSCLQ